MKIKITFLGGAGTVTGSKYFIQTPELNFLVDCGLFQGLKNLRLKNREPFPVAIDAINAVLITHAHLDHTGYLPVLVKEGYKNKIYLTHPTADLSKIILMDSAHLQKEDADYANSQGFSKHNPALPLYNEEDVINTISLFERCETNQFIKLSANIKFKYVKNGHILGSCFIELHCYGKVFVFSGDVGNYNSYTMFVPEAPPEKIDYLFVESTYGNRVHEPDDDGIQFSKTINDTLHRHGNVLIPSFAVGRAQELIYIINKLKKENKIPDAPVYFDTPMGVNATDLYCRYPEWHKVNTRACEIFFGSIKKVQSVKDTYDVIANKQPKIVIAASGMLTGGRVLHYLRSYITRPENTVVLAGYQAEGTRGRDLQEGAPDIKIFGEYFNIKAQVAQLSSLSAHADQKQLLDWLSAIQSQPGSVFVIHGEPASAHAFKLKLESRFKWKTIVPQMGDVIDLSL